MRHRSSRGSSPALPRSRARSGMAYRRSADPPPDLDRILPNGSRPHRGRVYRRELSTGRAPPRNCVDNFRIHPHLAAVNWRSCFIGRPSTVTADGSGPMRKPAATRPFAGKTERSLEGAFSLSETDARAARLALEREL